MTAEERAEVQIRHARWLIEQAAPAIASMPQCAAALETARQLLGQIGGDYRADDAWFMAHDTP